jgi:hypothetical protein
MAWASKPSCVLNRELARGSVQMRKRHGRKVPDAIILAMRNSQDFPLSLGSVLHPSSL